MKTTKSPEFDGWRWVSFWYPVRQVVSFKRDVYRKVMKEFASVLFTDNPPIFSASREANSQSYSANKKYSQTKYTKRYFYKSKGQ